MKVSERIKQIRERTGLSQQDFATSIGLKRPNYANIETGRQEPTLDTVTEIVTKYKDTVELATYEYILAGIKPEPKMASNLASKMASNPKNEVEKSFVFATPGRIGSIGTYGGDDTDQTLNEPVAGEEVASKVNAELAKMQVTMPRVITIDTSGEENVIYVPVKARAGYLSGYTDASFIEKLPAFRLPGFRNGTFRIFEVEGTSMFNTLHDKDKVIARWSTVSEIRDDRVYVLITKNDGILVKRVINRYQEGKIICKSDNNHKGEWPAIVLDVYDILEIWYVVETWSRQLSPPGEIYKRMVDLEGDVAIMKDMMKQLTKAGLNKD